MKQYNSDGYPKTNTHNKMIDVRKSVANGMSPVDAINQHCNTAESYAAGIRFEADKQRLRLKLR